MRLLGLVLVAVFAFCSYSTEIPLNLNAIEEDPRELPLEFSALIDTHSLGLIYNANVTLYNSCVDLDQQYVEIDPVSNIIFLMQTAKVSSGICLYLITKRLTSFILGDLGSGEYKVFDVSTSRFLGTIVVDRGGGIYHHEFQYTN